MSSEPANSIVTRLGGVGTVADILGIARSTVWKWTYPKGRSGGTGGMIPPRYYVPLLDHARSKGIPLTAADFLPRPTQAEDAA